MLYNRNFSNFENQSNIEGDFLRLDQNNLRSESEDPRTCKLIGSVSGRYEGLMTSSINSNILLELRIDIDPRYPNSPIMNRISGDFYEVNNLPSMVVNLSELSELKTYITQGIKFEESSWRIYRESWIVDNPIVNWSGCNVKIKGVARFWKGFHLNTNIEIFISWESFNPVGPAEVTFKESGGNIIKYNCIKKSDCFRDLTLEIDVAKSVNVEPILPSYDTESHLTRPADFPRRIITLEEAYREAGVCLSINPERTIIDDTTNNFTTWDDAELHDAMETYYSQYSGNWPKWHMWGLLCGSYDDPLTGGIMFDAGAEFGGSGEPPERQGFAVFRNHQWFNKLVNTIPINQDQAWAARQFLYTYVHEAGHAFNLLHSWDKGRKLSLSWMNYPQRVPGFWENFRFKFDDEELIHIRHGDRSSVIMGGDPWSSGGHLESSAGAMAQLEGQPPIELLLRSKDYFDYLEPVTVEIRIRNLLSQKIALDTRLNPEYGIVIIYIKRPDDKIVQYKPIIYKEGIASVKILQERNSNVSGEDRYNENILLNYGKGGFYFDKPGEYFVRALYQGTNSITVTSNTLRFRVGNPESRSEDRFATNYFSYQSGMNLYLYGSQSPWLEKGRKVLEETIERYKDTVVGAKVATYLAKGEARPFFRIKKPGKKPVLEQTHKPDYKKVLKITNPALALCREKKDKNLNMFYHDLVHTRTTAMKKLNEEKEAHTELSQLYNDLSNRGVKEKVLRNIKEYQKSLE